MENKNLGIKFTEDTYATKSEVSRALGITLVDNIWANILEYRSTFNRMIGLQSIEGNKLVFCYCPTISDEIARLNSKVNKLSREFLRATSSGKNDESLLKRQTFIECLSYLAKEKKLDVDNTYLRDIVDRHIVEISPSNSVLKYYHDALEYVYHSFVNPVDDTFLANIFSHIYHVDEIVSFYRSEEDRSKENRVLIDRIYSSAPVSMIEPLMSSLYDFLSVSSLSPICKALICYYYINYVKPFPSHNDEIAILMMKAIIAHEDVGEAIILAPLEKFLSEDLDALTKVCVEVQRTSDITYFINYGLKMVSKVIDNLLDHIAKFTSQTLVHDFYKPEAVVQEAQMVTTQVTPQEETKAVIEPVSYPTNEIQENREVSVPTEVSQLAVAYIPPVIDEKEATRLEQDLLESDPSMKKGEAYFYARHCTLNKRYTIGQYKKSLGCAYETARTSMEHLAHLGYYRKEMVKNKFVYTPIDRRRGE